MKYVQVFTSKSFGDHSMVFVYDFYPGAETLMSKHFNNPGQLGNGEKNTCLLFAYYSYSSLLPQLL